MRAVAVPLRRGLKGIAAMSEFPGDIKGRCELDRMRRMHVSTLRSDRALSWTPKMRQVAKVEPCP
jgi:hypothetical protein